jgi:hypothetical protein
MNHVKVLTVEFCILWSFLVGLLHRSEVSNDVFPEAGAPERIMNPRFGSGRGGINGRDESSSVSCLKWDIWLIFLFKGTHRLL